MEPAKQHRGRRAREAAPRCRYIWYPPLQDLEEKKEQAGKDAKSVFAMKAEKEKQLAASTPICCDDVAAARLRKKEEKEEKGPTWTFAVTLRYG
ncbi:hypothetical protein PG996_012379 [Apiospora saccharicola]|uniref:Uncharacterized protein n=1 Tax=Apiospora saccharicola TaxID=335842 RepID=A0ABR1U2N6_9PEZI